MRRTSTTAGGVLLAKRFIIKFLPGHAITFPSAPKHDLVVQGRHLKLSEAWGVAGGLGERATVWMPDPASHAMPPRRRWRSIL
jgi:hypothetical protein